MTRHDPRLKMPVFRFAFQIALSDIDALEHGPTEAVLGSHYSGRDAPTGSDKTDSTPIVFEGRRPTPLYAKAGDVYIFNYQTWHRGAPNASDRTRYLMQNQYCKRWCTDRFFRPENLCNLPAGEMAGAPEQLVKLLRYKK